MRCEPEYLVEKYQQNLFRVALSITHNVQDAEDAVQNAYLQYLKEHTDFDSEEHIRAWLIKTVCNQSKDILKAFWHRNRTSLEEWMNDQYFKTSEDRSLVEAVLHLPGKYSSVMHLYYYEDYTVKEISSILSVSQSAVKHRLQKGRELLRKQLENNIQEEHIYE